MINHTEKDAEFLLKRKTVRVHINKHLEEGGDGESAYDIYRKTHGGKWMMKQYGEELSRVIFRDMVVAYYALKEAS